MWEIHMLKGVVLLLTLSMLVLVVACNGPRYKRVTETEPAPSPVAESWVTAVRVIHPRPANEMSTGQTLSATIKAQKQALLAFQVSGQVATVLVEQGDRVKADDVLAELDKQLFQAQRDQAASLLAQAQAQLDLTLSGGRPEEIAMAQAQVDSAQAQLDKAKADYERALRLYEQGVIPKQQLDAAETGLKQCEQALKAAQQQLALAKQGAREDEKRIAQAAVQAAQASLAQAETQLEYATLRAPFAGSISMRQLESGQVAAAGLPVFEIADTKVLEAQSEVPEDSLASLAPGAQAKLSFPALPGLTVLAEVTSIAPRANPATRGFAITLLLKEPPAQVLPGMIAVLDFSTKLPAEGMVIPRRCLADGYVYVAESSTARKRAVEVIQDLGEDVVVKGLQSSDQIISSGQEYLEDGASIRIVDALGIDDLTTLANPE